MGNPTIRTQDNREAWEGRRWLYLRCHKGSDWLPFPLMLERWQRRPSLLWRVMHRLGAV